MKKKLLSLLLILSLVMGMTGTTFAGAMSNKGYTMENPMGLNSELKITDLKTANGTWKNASIKVSEVQIDNAGYKKANSLQAIVFSEATLRKADALKVKVTYTFSGFTGNKDSLIKDNLLAEHIYALNTKGVYKTSGQIYSGFDNALHNKVEKYTVGGKTYKGEWYGKKVKDVNFSKPVSMTGYVYLIMDKGKTDGSFVNFTFSAKNNTEKLEVFFVSSNKALESRIKKTGSYIYGDEQLGIAKADYEMKLKDIENKSFDDLGLVQKYYSYGSSSDSIIEFGLMGSEDNAFTEEQINLVTKHTADRFKEEFGLEVKEQNGIYSVIGISEDYSKYVNIHIINKGANYVIVYVYSDIKEKAAADKLWESYKSNNDLSKVAATPVSPTTNTDKGTPDVATKPKETSNKPLGKYVYGEGQYGTFTSLEELVQVKSSDTAIMRFNSKSGDAFYTLQYFGNGQMNVEGLDKNVKEMFPDAVVGKIDNGNITVYTDNSYTYDCATVLMISKNNQINTFIIALPKKAVAQKETVIKSYLMSMGYTAQQAETLATSAIFD